MPSIPKICHRCDVKQSLGNHVHVDPLNRINPRVVIQIDDQYNVLQYLAESRVTQGIAELAHRPVANVATRIPMLVHPLPDRTQPHWDLKRVAKCETDLQKTK